MSEDKKPKVATAAFCSCFGCHMSILDIDGRILTLAKLVDFDKSPIDDIKELGECAVGIVEGGIANTENLELLREFRRKCKYLVALGDCSIMGGVPAMRNTVPLRECFEEAYINCVSVDGGIIPNDPELPTLLDRVYPVQAVVKIDFFIPGCPPPADTIWKALIALLTGKELDLPYELVKYD